MKKSTIISIVVALLAIILVAVLIFSISHRHKKPIEKEGEDKNSHQSSQKTITDKLPDDLKKYREKKPVSNEETNPKEANKEGLDLNADNKVLVQTDSNNAEKIKECMVKWNHALGENVFIPAKANGRTDLLVQDDETKIPVDIFRNTKMGEDMPQDYMTRVVPTTDRRIMILDNFNTRNKSEFNNALEDELNQSLGHTIGITKDTESIRKMLSSDEGRKQLQDEFKKVKDRKLYNEGLTPNSKEADGMNSTYNKTYTTWTNFKNIIGHLPRFKGHDDKLKKEINSTDGTLYGKEATQKGKAINQALQDSMKQMDKGGTYKHTDATYRDDKEKHDGHQTVANSPSTMGDDNDFINLTRDYAGGE
ncbi:hypothetical protein [Staphylococcus capitis]|uniref:DUF443 domain-containing protein n=2 Tax=Staphylococcus capitis TaxID=29388 RepID=A0ABX1SQQ7_STACP|nr:hypothetical protein [Staphylococcus capitis]NMK53967.1 DUF443 domain-containing protein [Staphylococcus capitis]NMK69340.1 DUF443 domain-containing protein [Staphylococcus capitis]